MLGLTPVKILNRNHRRREENKNSEAGNDSEVLVRKISLSDFTELSGRALEILQARNRSSAILIHVFRDRKRSLACKCYCIAVEFWCPQPINPGGRGLVKKESSLLFKSYTILEE